MTHTPADQLRAAAKKLRLTAGNATEGAWAIWRDLDHQGYITVGNAAGVITPPALQSAGGECTPVAHVYVEEDAQHIALMHPGVGLTLADWLADYAADWEQCPEDHPGTSVDEHALVVARRVLGETTTDTGADETHVVTDDSDDPEHADNCPGCETFSLTGHTVDLRDRITTAISKWHRDPEQPFYTQGADAVLAVQPTGADRAARCTCGETTCESDLCDCDTTPCPVAHATDEAQPADLRERIAAALTASLAEWWQTPPRLDVAADAVLAALPAPADRAAAQVATERDCLAMAVMFARQWTPSAPMTLRDGIDEILATMPSRLADEAQQPPGGATEGAPYPPEVQWIAQELEGGDEWMQLASGTDRGYVEGRLTSYRTRSPHGLTTRLIRVTTTYTVEQPAPAVTEEPTL